MCSSLALSSAGVEMVDLPVACAVVCAKCMHEHVSFKYFNSQRVENTFSLTPAYQKSIVRTEFVIPLYFNEFGYIY